MCVCGVRLLLFYVSDYRELKQESEREKEREPFAVISSPTSFSLARDSD